MVAMALLALGGRAMAQDMKMFEGSAFSRFSPNGNWLVENNAGMMSILNDADGSIYTLADESGLEMYSPGLGQSVANSGKICGFTMTKGAFLWEGGQLLTIDEPSGIGTSFNGAQAFTPDETTIVGALGSSGASLGYDGLACYPVVWKLNAAGEYVCSPLPYLGKDFSGGTPQSVVATAVSADGRTVAGMLTSWNGFYTFPIVFRQDDGGNWTYTLLGKNNVYDESRLSELPEMPVEPVEPDYNDYMTESDKANYAAALEQYQSDLEDYYNDPTLPEPTYPTPDLYMSDDDQKAQYTAAVTQYVQDHNSYLKAWIKYSNALDKITTSFCFTRNNIYLSANGRYLATSLQHDGLTTPGYFDLTEADPQFVMATDNGYSMLTTGVLDDGTIFAASPVVELTRSSFAIAKGASAPATFHDYLATRSPQAAKWLADNNAYDVALYDEAGETATGIKNDSIISGTVGVSYDGKVFVSYYTDYNSASQTTKSFVIRLDDAAGISGAAKGGGDCRITLRGGAVEVVGDGATTVSLYSAAGALLATAKGDGTVRLASPGYKGAAIVKATSGTTVTTKTLLLK